MAADFPLSFRKNTEEYSVCFREDQQARVPWRALLLSTFLQLKHGIRKGV